MQLAVGSAAAQGGVGALQGQEAGGQLLGTQRRRRLQPHALHEAAGHAVLLGEPADDGQLAHRACLVVGRRIGGGQGLQRRGHAGWRALGEHVARTQQEAGAAQLGAQAHRRDAVAAQLEEIVVGAGLLQIQDSGHRRAQQALGLVGRFAARSGVLRPDRRQRLAVYLAVDVDRPFRQHRQRRRHHVVGQRFRQLRQQRGGQPRLLMAAGLGHRAVGDQAVAAADRFGQRHGGVDAGEAGQRVLDLAHLDAEAAHLDLVVDAADEIHLAMGVPAHQVAGAVHQLAVAEGAGDEARRGQRRAVQIPKSQAVAGQIQLAGHAYRHRTQRGVQHQRAGIGHRPAHHWLLGDGPRRAQRGDRVFGRAVEIMEMQLRVAAHLLPQRRRHRLAAHHHHAGLPMAVVHQAAIQHLPQQRRRHVHLVDALAAHQLHQLLGVAAQFLVAQMHFLAHQQPEQLLQRAVEGQRGGLHRAHSAAPAADEVAEQSSLLAQQQVEEAGVGDHHAFRLPGGAGGVDHVGQPVAIQRTQPFRVVQRLGGAGGQPRADLAIIQAQRRQVRQPAANVGAGQQQGRRGVLAHHRQPLGRIIQIQRQEGGAGRQRAQYRHHGVDAARHGDADHAAVANAARQQFAPQLRDAGRQLAIAQPLVAADQRGFVFALRGAGQEHVHRRAHAGRRVDARTARPFVQRGLLRGAMQWRVAHLRAAGQSGDEAAQPPGMPFQLRRVVARRIGAQLHHQRLALLPDAEFDVFDRPHRQWQRDAFHLAQPQRLVIDLQVQRRAVQRAARSDHAAVALDLLGVVTLAAPRLLQFVGQPPRERSQIVAVADIQRHRQHIHHRPGRAQRRRPHPPHEGHAHRHPRFARHLRQIGESGSHGQLRRAQAGSQAAQRPRVAADQFKPPAQHIDIGRAVAGQRVARRQGGRRRQRGGVAAPKRAVFLAARAGQVGLALGRHRGERDERRRRRRFAAAQGLVNVGDAAGQRGEAVAVHANMVVALIPEPALAGAARQLEQAVQVQRTLAVGRQPGGQIVAHPLARARFRIGLGAQILDAGKRQILGAQSPRQAQDRAIRRFQIMANDSVGLGQAQTDGLAQPLGVYGAVQCYAVGDGVGVFLFGDLVR
ncbi:Uncharacterised protein [Chromobacterium violaceum]|nr:Uncharacterised protein [Chromobacterium violaceum]